VATHFLRNGEDGTDDSNDENPLEQRDDRHAALEGTLQISMSCLLGITIQCARCHDHKLEPITQRDYYSLQAIFRPAFDPDNWVTPGRRLLDFELPNKQILRVAAVIDMPSDPPDHHLLIRGRYDAPGPVVQPGVPSALSSPGNPFKVVSVPNGTGRRLALARWVTSDQNPLFARVMVNRVWQHHFGIGLVPTHDNFGQSGAAPSHPQLLDFLAAEFTNQRWSIKALHRLLVCSAVYRQSSRSRDEAQAVDPENRLLWRYRLRRLDAEAIRDAMLTVTGELNTHMYGPSVWAQNDVTGEAVISERLRHGPPRSVYVQQRRSQTYTMLAMFDAPAMSQTCSQRDNSTTPSQSLFLLNSDFFQRRAAIVSKRLRPAAGVPEEQRIHSTFCSVLRRPPSVDEMAATKQFIQSQGQLAAADKRPSASVWADLCQMIFASNAFLYIE